MASLTINTGSIQLDVLDGHGNNRGVFRFNPTDVNLAKRFMVLFQDFKTYLTEVEKVQNLNPEDGVDLLIQTVEKLEHMIDECFGSGTSNLLFGEDKTMQMFEDFFSGLVPYFQNASEQRIAKYKKDK